MNSLPTPSLAAQQHSQRLIAIIVDDINAQGGAISFARYMELVLYEPGLGYYSAGSQKFGAEGDFVTAPLISPLFSHCIARQSLQVLADLGGGDILELGAGTGKMASDILLYLEQQQQLPGHYYILELSAELQQRQQQTLQQCCPQFAERVVWLNQLPSSFTGVILGNEVLDAMPVHRFAIEQEDIQECCVTYKSQRFAWQLTPLTDSALSTRANTIREQYLSHCQHYQTEINRNVSPWINSLADCLQRGLMLLIDYGFPAHEYYHPERHMGTLMCHYQHRAHSDPFVYPGLQDITAHVDFTQVAQSAVDAELDVLGYTNQAAFLLNCGLLDELPAAPNQQMACHQAIKRLTMPHEMGELFKVIALGRQLDNELLGFSRQDLRSRL